MLQLLNRSSRDHENCRSAFLPHSVRYWQVQKHAFELFQTDCRHHHTVHKLACLNWSISLWEQRTFWLNDYTHACVQVLCSVDRARWRQKQIRSHWSRTRFQASEQDNNSRLGLHLVTVCHCNLSILSWDEQYSQFRIRRVKRPRCEPEGAFKLKISTESFSKILINAKFLT